MSRISESGTSEVTGLAEPLRVARFGRWWIESDADVRDFVGDEGSPFGEHYSETFRKVLARCLVQIEGASSGQDVVANAMPLYESALAQAGLSDRSFQHFADAWIGAAVRLAAVREHALRFQEAFDRAASPEFDNETDPKYREWLSATRDIDRALFDTVANAQSAVECIGFALYAILAIVRPAAFPLRSERDVVAVKVGATLKALESPNGFPTELVTKALREMTRSEVFEDLRQARNLLLHRGSPRGWILGGPSGPTGDYYYSIEMGANSDDVINLDRTTALGIYIGLAASLNVVVRSTHALVARRLA